MTEQNNDSIILMHHVTSDSVRAFGYDAGYNASRRVLRIKFRSGGTYDYMEVPPEVYEELQNADSYGSFVARKLRTKYRAVPLVTDGWDGEERRVLVEPLQLSTLSTSHQLTLEDGAGSQIRLECLDLTAEDERLFAERLCVCVNALVGVPSQRVMDVVMAGLVALGKMERRKVEEGTHGEQTREPDEPSIEEESAITDAVQHEEEARSYGGNI